MISGEKSSNVTGDSSATVVPEPDDILFGRGRRYDSHPGNLRLRALVDANVTRYNKTQSRSAKTRIAKTVLDQVTKSGRFLKYDEEKTAWVEVNRSSSRIKVSQAFRYRQRQLLTGDGSMIMEWPPMEQIRNVVCQGDVGGEGTGQHSTGSTLSRALQMHSNMQQQIASNSNSLEPTPFMGNDSFSTRRSSYGNNWSNEVPGIIHSTYDAPIPLEGAYNQGTLNTLGPQRSTNQNNQSNFQTQFDVGASAAPRAPQEPGLAVSADTLFEQSSVWAPEPTPILPGFQHQQYSNFQNTGDAKDPHQKSTVFGYKDPLLGERNTSQFMTNTTGPDHTPHESPQTASRRYTSQRDFDDRRNPRLGSLMPFGGNSLLEHLQHGMATDGMATSYCHKNTLPQAPNTFQVDHQTDFPSATYQQCDYTS